MKVIYLLKKIENGENIPKKNKSISRSRSKRVKGGNI